MTLRETIMITATLLMTLLFSCEPIESEQYGFNIQARPGSSGFNSVKVDLNIRTIHLTGIVTATDGKLSVEVMSPAEKVLFSAVIEAPGELLIDRSLPAEAGEWRIRYLSSNGTGYIRLQMHLIR